MKKNINQRITRLETSKLLRWWRQPANAVNTAIMRFATWLGDGWLWGFVMIVIVWKTDPWIAFATLWRACLVGAASILVYKYLKGKFNRPRPFERQNLEPLQTPPDQFSFPSGHTMNNAVTTFFLGHLHPWLLPYLLPITVLVGFSRVYLRVHYATDVIMGYLLGSGLAFIAYHIPILNHL